MVEAGFVRLEKLFLLALRSVLSGQGQWELQDTTSEKEQGLLSHGFGFLAVPNSSLFKDPYILNK